MTVRGLVKTKRPQWTNNPHARSIHRDKDHGLLAVTRRIGIRFPHHDRDTTTWVHRARDPLLASVHDIEIAITSDSGLDICGVR